MLLTIALFPYSVIVLLQVMLMLLPLTAMPYRTRKTPATLLTNHLFRLRPFRQDELRLLGYSILIAKMDMEWW